MDEIVIDAVTTDTLQGGIDGAADHVYNRMLVETAVRRLYG